MVAADDGNKVNTTRFENKGREVNSFYCNPNLRIYLGTNGIVMG